MIHNSKPPEMFIIDSILNLFPDLLEINIRIKILKERKKYV
jgi:hypothetical protein